MGEWKTVTLDDVTTILGDGLHGTPVYDDQGEFYFINGNNLVNGRIHLKPETRRVGVDEYKKHKKELNERTILVSINGTLGNIALYNGEPCVLGKSACYFNVDESVDRLYVKYVLMDKAFQSYIYEYATGTTIKNMSLKAMREFAFELPDQDEQRSIAWVLSSLDAKIDLLHRQNKTLEAMAETLFRQWFVEEAEEGLTQRPLSSVANYLNGVACQKYPAKDPVNRLPVLKIKDLRDGLSESSDWATTDIDPKYYVEAGDVIFSWSASLIVKLWDGPKAILNQHLFKVTSDEFPKWFYFMWTKHYVDEFVSIATSHATTFGHIKRGDLDEAMVVVPGPVRLKEMTLVMEPLVGKHITNSAQIKSLTSLRDTLLPKLMSGEVRVETNNA